MKDVPRLAREELPSAQLWQKKDDKELPNLLVLRDHFKAEGKLFKADAMRILASFCELNRKEANAVKLSSPVYIVGDIHGQVYDMFHMFDKLLENKWDRFKEASLLCLGDYVDRGDFGVEVFLFLACLKLNYPNKVWMLRGNHESFAMNETFNFRAEVFEKFKGDDEVFEAFQAAF